MTELPRDQRVHFVGIGGIGMSGIARVLLEMGYRVSGSDLRGSHITKSLEALGASCFTGHQAENIAGADIVVVSTAVSEANPEVAAALAAGIPVIKRAEMLGYLMQARFGIAIAGTHGKTTTTSMVAHVLRELGQHPTVIIGGEFNELGSNAQLGTGQYLVAEADESDASFLSLSPRMAVVTNIDADINLNASSFSVFNYDYQRTLTKVVETFVEFLGSLPPDGRAIVCVDNAHVRRILPQVARPQVTYGIDHEADFTVDHIQLAGFRARCRVRYRGVAEGRLDLAVPGRHNILNALAALAVGRELGFSFRAVSGALRSFEGVQRRFQILGQGGGVTVVDDYAHNPAKILAALHAARTGGARRVIAVFQPHRYTRTKFLFEEFGKAFRDADLTVVTDIYSAGEPPMVGVTGERMAAEIKASGSAVSFVPDKDDVPAFIAGCCRRGDLVITLGAGDIDQVARAILARVGAKGLQNAASM